jgi:hypothetical protein
MGVLAVMKWLSIVFSLSLAGRDVTRPRGSWFRIDSG